MKKDYKLQLNPGLECSYINDLLFEKTELLGEENGENLAVTSTNSKFVEKYLIENKLILNLSENFETKEKIVEMKLWNIISELKKKMIDNFVYYSNLGKTSYVVYDKSDICEIHINNIYLSQKLKTDTKQLYIYNANTFPKIEENKMKYFNTKLNEKLKIKKDRLYDQFEISNEIDKIINQLEQNNNIKDMGHIYINRKNKNTKDVELQIILSKDSKKIQNEIEKIFENIKNIKKQNKKIKKDQ